MRLDPDPESLYYLREFVELHKRSIPVSQLSEDKIRQKEKELGVSLLEEFRAFSTHDGLPITLVSCRDHSKFIPTFKSFYPFYAANGLFWMIPCETPNKLLGFVLRGWNPTDRTKKYVRFQVHNGIPMVFGLHHFANFQARTPSSPPVTDTPLILVEGIKDALYLKKFYPYVLALLTNYASEPVCELLSKMTRQVVISMDNDKYGQGAVPHLEKHFKKFQVTTYPLLMPGSCGTKDWGSAFVDPLVDRVCSLKIQGFLRKLGIQPPE